MVKNVWRTDRQTDRQTDRRTDGLNPSYSCLVAAKNRVLKRSQIQQMHLAKSYHGLNEWNLRPWKIQTINLINMFSALWTLKPKYIIKQQHYAIISHEKTMRCYDQIRWTIHAAIQWKKLTNHISNASYGALLTNAHISVDACRILNNSFLKKR